MRTAPISKSRKILFAITAAALSVLLTCVVMEIVLRQLHLLDTIPWVDIHGDPVWTEDQELVYRMRPEMEAVLQRFEFSIPYKTNAHGYRDEEFSIPPDETQFIIAGLGDSFGWGHGVEQDESFYEIAERRLGREFKGLKIHNLSVHGYSQKQHANQIEIAKRLGAKLVVIAVCTQNDWVENADILSRRMGSNGRRADRAPERKLELRDEEGVHSALYRQSHLVQFIVSRLQLLNPSSSLGHAAWYIVDGTRAHPDPETAHALEVTERLLTRILEQCRSEDLQLALVTIPGAWEASESVFTDLITQYGTPREEMDRRRITEFYKKFCERHDIPCLDLIDTLAAESSKPEEFYFPIDRHLNKRGHKVAGEALAQFLTPIVEPLLDSKPPDPDRSSRASSPNSRP